MFHTQSAQSSTLSFAHLQRITQGITRVRLRCDNALYGVFGLFIAKNPAINQIFRFIFSAQPGIRTRQPQPAKNVHLYDNYEN